MRCVSPVNSDNHILNPKMRIKGVEMNIITPIKYLQSVIREDTPERVSAFLAVAAGLALVVGFLAIILAITYFHQKLTTELLTISGALVTLSTFNKVDQSPIITATKSVTSTSEGNTVTNTVNTNTSIGGSGRAPTPLPVPSPTPTAPSAKVAPGVGSDD